MTNTLRVDISYRPLRIGWAVRSGDVAAVRQAIRYSHALWGGCFSPILVVDREEEARQLVELFRLDFIQPIGDSQAVKDFPALFPHLARPFDDDTPFVKSSDEYGFSLVLDVQNAITHWQGRPEWQQIMERGWRAYQWQPSDPLADVFLMQFGAYPAVKEVGVDYAKLVEQRLRASASLLAPNTPLPSDIVDHSPISELGQLGLDRHYVVHPGWDTPGFFVGSVSDFDDLVAYWNILACDIPLCFVDPDYIERYAELIPKWVSVSEADAADGPTASECRLAVWSRRDIDEMLKHFPDVRLMRCPIADDFWSGKTVIPPVMHLGQPATLGVIGDSDGVPCVNFALAEKPFCSDRTFGLQQLVASISFIGGLYDDEQHTFDVPYVPELNGLYEQMMHFSRGKLRCEPGSIGLIIYVFDHDKSIEAMPVGLLFNRIFSLAGFNASLSNSGRIVRQLLTQIGGVQGARVFKVPGARALLKRFGLTDTFTRDSALNVIRDKSPECPRGTFAAHRGLFLSPRPDGTELTPPEVFAFMVRKGLFRMGADLRCQRCDMTSWVSLDVLKQSVTCELCGHGYDATAQLIDLKWRFRRSGVLGTERSAQGAIPVSLALQQLETAFYGLLGKGMYSPSLEMRPVRALTLPECEIDFVWLEMSRLPKRPSLIFAECKDQGPIHADEFLRDVDNLRRVADAFPPHRFDTYILFVKLAAFTKDEIEMASALNGPDRHRVILLTARELEPYDILEGLREEIGKDALGVSPDDLAEMTARLYFSNPVARTLAP